MLDELLAGFANPPDIWGEGALFAFSGLDGPTQVESGFVATLAAEPFGLLIHTPRRRVLAISLSHPALLRIATGDVLGASGPRGDLLVTFSAWHTIVGVAPPGAALSLAFEDGEDAEWENPFWITADGPQGQTVAFGMGRGGRFALACGANRDEANERVRVGLVVNAGAEAAARLAPYARLPRCVPERIRLLKKCFAVMKVNTLAAEGAIAGRWSTPDRVPHRDMWLWDSAFHALGMNSIDPRLAWEYLQAVLDTQLPGGQIPYRTGVAGPHPEMTQPPLLAWAAWDCYQAADDRHILEHALPRLEAYIAWDLAQRSAGRASLLAWQVTDDPRCRCPESGMDNSPRFERGVPLDSVDFTTFLAQEMQYLALMETKLGRLEQAAAWYARGRELSAGVHSLLWDNRAGFYFDRGRDGIMESVRAVSGFYPLLLDDIPAERVARLVAALRDSSRFGTPCPVPSVAAADPRFSTDMWRGPAWVNTNYLVIKGLRRHGYKDEARRLARSTVDIVDKYYRRYGVLFEFYDSQDRVPPPLCDRKGPHSEPYSVRGRTGNIRDYHWTAALTARIILEGLDVE